ncbi:LysR family transcriptional regulator [Ferrimonas aestuarii]|uniref:LysR family transcriptional regulator n=1 Tax=Ferrimonas aestuarii TaxID=2569539 RepID=A0A4U1BPH2_9GAMM|nr:LysR family transcriptional regulator [Ferrimonas aestuarii]TKB55442.1 LysR family transcriptional regulator [Ferrimonas aestuarii]
MSSIFGNLDDLFLFCLVVKFGSMQSASERLSLPIATASRRLTQLEKRLSLKLLERQGRVLQPTPSGLALYERLQPQFEGSELHLQEVLDSQHQVSGSLSLYVPIAFYSGHLAPVIEHFLLCYPDVRLQVHLAKENHIPQHERELVVGFVEPKMGDYIAKPYFFSDNGLYASRGYLVEYGTPTTPEALYQHHWLTHDGSRSLSLSVGDQAVELQLQPRMEVNDITSLVQSLKRGLGIGELPRHRADSEPELVEVLGEYRHGGRQAYLSYKRRQYQPKAMTLLIEALLAAQKSPH